MKITMDSGKTIAETLRGFAREARDIRKAIVEGKEVNEPRKRLTKLRLEIEKVAREFEVVNEKDDIDDLLMA